MVMILAFFVAQPMKTGRRRCSVCQPSAASGSNTGGKLITLQRNHAHLHDMWALL